MQIENVMTRRNTPRVSFIGFGEAGQAIAAGLRETGIERIAAWDILFPEPSGARLKAAGEAIGVRLANSAVDAVAETDMIISAVTAASRLEAARSVEPHLTAKPYYLDINSVSPGRKQATAKLLGERARYVDVAVIAPINPARHRTPLLIAGPHAEAISPLRGELQMQLSIVGANSGRGAALHAAADRRPARRGDFAAAGRIADAAVDRGRQYRPGRRHQDDPQRDDQGHRGAHGRMLPRRRPRRRARRSDGVAQEQLPDARFHQDRRIQSGTHGEPRRTPRCRNGRVGRHFARARA